MRAVVYSGYGAPPELTEVADPACPADGVVIAVGATGVCRSDWHAWQGHDPVALPNIGGHEFAGVVAATGPEVRRWQAGDRVTVPFALRLRHLRVLPGRRRPGMPAADPAGIHRAGVLRRVRGGARGGREPGFAPGPQWTS